jgi:hypothetical protein
VRCAFASARRNPDRSALLPHAWRVAENSLRQRRPVQFLLDASLPVVPCGWVGRRDRWTSSHKRQKGAPFANNSAIRSRSLADNRSTHASPNPNHKSAHDAMTT